MYKTVKTYNLSSIIIGKIFHNYQTQGNRNQLNFLCNRNLIELDLWHGDIIYQSIWQWCWCIISAEFHRYLTIKVTLLPYC